MENSLIVSPLHAQPPGYHATNAGKVGYFRKTLYCLKQSWPLLVPSLSTSCQAQFLRCELIRRLFLMEESSLIIILVHL